MTKERDEKDLLAEERTVLAKSRTANAYIRTGAAILGIGLAVLKFFYSNSVMMLLGGGLCSIGAIAILYFFLWGIHYSQLVNDVEEEVRERIDDEKVTDKNGKTPKEKLKDKITPD